MTSENTKPECETELEPLFTELSARSVNPETFSLPRDGDALEFLKISLNFPYSFQEWDTIFAKLLELLARPEPDIWKDAIERLIRMLEMEESQRSNCDDYRPTRTEERVRAILDAIATQTLQKPGIFEFFCSRFKFLAKKSPYNALIREGLEVLAAVEDNRALSSDDLLAAQIFFGVFDTTWDEVGAFLLERLDSENLNLRACAAYQLGKFCYQAQYGKQWEDDEEKIERAKQAVSGMPSLEAMMQLIRSKEIERPGIAGAFWHEIPKESFDPKEWLLDVLENSPKPEPYIPYFPCNLAFDAHERFNCDPDAIRRLIDMGRISIAVMAATDESCKNEALEPLLMELGNSAAIEDLEDIRLAAWHLAYYYHKLHQRGQKLGYVELVELQEIDLFLLFSRREQSESPYAAVIYPKEGNGKLSQKEAKKWVDRIFPAEIRGARREDLPQFVRSTWYQHGYINYHQDKNRESSDLIDNVIIGYRSQQPWNPKAFL